MDGEVVGFRAANVHLGLQIHGNLSFEKLMHGADIAFSWETKDFVLQTWISAPAIPCDSYEED